MKKLFIAVIFLGLCVAAFAAGVNIYDGTGVKHLRAPSDTVKGQQTNSAVSMRQLIGTGFVIATCSSTVTNFVLQGSENGTSGWEDISNQTVSGATNIVLRINFSNEPLYFRTIVGASDAKGIASAIAIGINQVN
jgi:hypothetical protein